MSSVTQVRRIDDTVQVMMVYEPAGTADASREVLGSLSARVQDTIENFKSFIESRAVGARN